MKKNVVGLKIDWALENQKSEQWKNCQLMSSVNNSSFAEQCENKRIATFQNVSFLIKTQQK